MKPWQVTRSGNLDSDMAITNNGTGPDRRQAATCSDEEYLGLDQPHARQEELFRRFLGLRYRLMPYLYTLVHSGWRTGMPVCRPLIMAFPDDPACREDQFPAQYLLGEDLLVAPVVDPEPTMAVHLPLGHDWVDFFTGQCFTGGQTIRMATDDLDRLPLFVRQGAVIPMQPAATWIEHGRNPDPLELHLWPAAAGGCLLIEDDGISLGYQRGETADLAVSYRCDDGRCIIDLAPVRGSYRGMPASRTVTIHLHGVGAEPVTIVVPAAQGAQVAVPLAEYGDAGG
jgi:hypothetical protein